MSNEDVTHIIPKLQQILIIPFKLYTIYGAVTLCPITYILGYRVDIILLY